MKKTNILVIDDKAAFRASLCMLLKKEPFVNSAYEAWDEETVTEVLTNHLVDIVLMDVYLRKTDGLELFDKVKSFDQKPYVIAITGLEGAEIFVNLMKAGINGIVHARDGGLEEIFKAIESAPQPGGYFSTTVKEIIQEYQDRWDEVPTVSFSRQEKEFIKAIGDGLEANEIAPLFNMTPGSAEQFESNLVKKAGAKDTAALIVFAFRNGVI